MERKNKGGRPRASRVQKKSRAVTVRYNALQYDIVRHRAGMAGFRTLTEYVREASVNAEVVQNFIQEHNAAFRNLSGLCNNLNQLTRLANAQGLHSTECALSDLSVVMPDSIGHPSHIVASCNCHFERAKRVEKSVTQNNYDSKNSNRRLIRRLHSIRLRQRPGRSDCTRRHHPR